jgi:hypothetical protein
LSLLNPNKPEFAILPPHWICDNPMGDANICQAMALMYGKIVSGWEKKTPTYPIGLLLICLALVILHAAEWIKQTATENPGHVFGAIPIIQHAKLLG